MFYYLPRFQISHTMKMFAILCLVALAVAEPTVHFEERFDSGGKCFQLITSLNQLCLQLLPRVIIVDTCSISDTSESSPNYRYFATFNLILNDGITCLKLF